YRDRKVAILPFFRCFGHFWLFLAALRSADSLRLIAHSISHFWLARKQCFFRRLLKVAISSSSTSRSCRRNGPGGPRISSKATSLASVSCSRAAPSMLSKPPAGRSAESEDDALSRSRAVLFSWWLSSEGAAKFRLPSLVKVVGVADRESLAHAEERTANGRRQACITSKMRS
ncbi:hypothetical protein B0H14DRAFT_3722030, partial [Mycena olivaceomarginata]